MDIKRVIKEYYEQLSANRFNSPNEMDQFLERYNLPKLTQKEIDSLKSLSTESINLLNLIND